MNLKALGSVLLAAGFLLGAYVVVGHEKHVEAVPYAVALGLMLGGMAALRLHRSQAAQQTEIHEQNLGVLDQSLERLIRSVEEYSRIDQEVELAGLHERIDRDLLEDIETFVSARESMVPRLGMQTFADVMAPFAAGERLLNRAWSSSADGYVDEVRSCVARALAQLRQAQSVLRRAETATQSAP